MPIMDIQGSADRARAETNAVKIFENGHWIIIYSFTDFSKTKSRATLDSHSWFLFLLKVGEKVALSVGHQNLITPYWDEDYSFFHSTFIQN